jgi:hypothetical protein
VAITAPTSNQALKQLLKITGTAADNAGGTGIDHVNIQLRRNSDLMWWSGSGWTTKVTPITVSGTSSWSKTSGLPSGGDLLDGSYSLWAYAFDKAGNVKSTGLQFIVDKTAPTSVAISAPAHRSTIAALTRISGTAADNPGGSALASVQLRLRRNSDLLYWNGTIWQANATFLPAVGTTSWSKTSGLPGGANLVDGSYSVWAYAFDRAGNFSNATATFAVKK